MIKATKGLFRIGKSNQLLAFITTEPFIPINIPNTYLVKIQKRKKNRKKWRNITKKIKNTYSLARRSTSWGLAK